MYIRDNWVINDQMNVWKENDGFLRRKVDYRL